MMMRKLLKISGLVMAALMLVAAVAVAWNYDRLERLYRVNTLFDEDRIVGNFSSMDKMFGSVMLPASDQPYRWPENPRPLPESFTFEGETWTVEGFLADSKTTSLLVVQDGEIVSENYLQGTGREDKRISWSMAKSFVSALIGIALEEGAIASIDDPVTKYVPEFEGSAYDGVPMRHVLNMASGIKFDEDYLDYNSDINRMGRVLALGQSMDGFALGLTERVRESGTIRQYTSIDTHVLAMVLRAATGKSLPQLLTENIWKKLEPADSGYYVTDGHGTAFALAGLNMRSREYARFGQLFLNEGRWHGKQVVPPGWARLSVTPTAPKADKEVDTFGYGYQWWIPPEPEDEFFAIGIYSQFIYVNRNTRTVIVKTSAHREFRDDDEDGFKVKRRHMAAFRTIATHYSGR